MESELVKTCDAEYVKLVQDQLSSIKETNDLVVSHAKIKAKILASLPIKWRINSKSSRVPLDVVAAVDAKLDESFATIRKSFESSRKKQPSKASPTSIRMVAAEIYKKEMDKYVSKHAMASNKELFLRHQEIVTSIVTRMKETFKDTIKSETVFGIKLDMESYLEYYQTRAQLNASSLLDPAIGIDLGTTNCCVMIYHKGEVQLIRNSLDGSSTTPSYVTFHSDKTDTFGREAKEAAYKYPEITIYDAKRMIGRSWGDKHIQAGLKNWPFQLENYNDSPMIRFHGEASRYPQEISARLLARLRYMAEVQLGMTIGTIKKAVITVPAYFNESQRRATKEAATHAGLQVLNLLSEPAAAAIAYNYDQIQGRDRKRVLIYDLGGGTFDVAIAQVSVTSVDVMGVAGHDFDQVLMAYCLGQFKIQNSGIDIHTSRESGDIETKNQANSALCRLKLQCELARERLSSIQRTNIEIEQLFQGKDLVVTVTKDTLENLVKPFVERTLTIVDQAIRDAADKGINSRNDIDEIILVGGVTRMPLVERKISEYFEGKRICKSINPDQAVAYGAAIQAAMMTSAPNMKKEIKIDDVLPMSIGIKTRDDNFTVMIPRNSKLPCEMQRMFATTSDNQMSTVVSVYQGEEKCCKDNKWLGEFVFRGFLPKPAGQERLQVTMSVDTMGILQVEAESLSTSRKNQITVDAERLEMDKQSVEKLTKECSTLNLE